MSATPKSMVNFSRTLLMLSLISTSLSAQYSFRVKAIQEMNTETRVILRTNPANEIFNISLTDEVLIHNVLDEVGNVKDSQVYKIISQEDRDGLLWLSCESGISGNVYEYIIDPDASAGPELFQYVDGKLFKLRGKMTPLKTFIQQEG